MIEILFLAKNRKRFTEACLRNLIVNTAWGEVSGLYVYDDLSSDGTREFLLSFDGWPVKPKLRLGEFGSPVQIMNEYLTKERTGADVFAKIDSDTMVPPGWLEECLRVMHRHPDLDLLGIEAFRPVVAGAVEQRAVDPADFIGGIGLMRRRGFVERAASLPVPNGRQGFTRWQEKNPEVQKGWLNPALPVFLLDWLPREPWLGLTKEYVRHGWNRDWHALFPNLCPYPEERRDLWSWYTP